LERDQPTGPAGTPGGASRCAGMEVRVIIATVPRHEIKCICEAGVVVAGRQVRCAGMEVRVIIASVRASDQVHLRGGCCSGWEAGRVCRDGGML